MGPFFFAISSFKRYVMVAIEYLTLFKVVEKQNSMRIPKYERQLIIALLTAVDKIRRLLST